MWFFYLLSAIGVSVGTGALVAYDSEQEISALIKASEPETHAESTVRISRALRRLYQINPAQFPSPTGGRTAQIPSNLLERAISGGVHLPRDIVFEIDSSGRIFSRVSDNSAMNTDRYTGAIERNSLNPEQVMNRTDRQIDAIRNPDPYIFDLTNNLEGLLPGELAVFSGGGITNPDPSLHGSSGSAGRDSIIGSFPDIVYQPSPGSNSGEMTNDTSPGHWASKPVFETTNGDDGGGTGITSANAPRAHGNESNSVSNPHERTFDGACFSILDSATDITDQMFDQYAEERASILHGYIEVKYRNKQQAFAHFFTQIRPPLIKAIQDAPEGETPPEQAKLDAYYEKNWDWGYYSSVSEATYQYNTQKASEKRLATNKATTEAEQIYIGINAGGAYCSSLYQARLNNINVDIPANGLSAEYKGQLRGDTHGMNQLKLFDDPAFNELNSANTNFLKRLMSDALKVRDVVESYPR